MKILLAGSSGFVGSNLSDYLKKEGHQVTVLTRSKEATPNSIYWDPSHQILNPKSVEGFDAWINLAGENISGRWTEEKKKKILESRVQTTELLAKVASELNQPPKVFLNASAVGFYGINRKGEKLTEESGPGTGFLSLVCQEWEKSLDPIEDKGVRVVKLRFGVILSPQGGALKTMALPFKLGLGGPIGDGSQAMSWIALEDILRIIQFSLTNEIYGPINCVSPQPVTNKEFTNLLAKALHRAAFLPMPAFLARFVLGEMADEMLLSSIYALPEELTHANFQFKYPALEPLLKDYFKG